MGIFIEVNFLAMTFLLFTLTIRKKVYVLGIHHSNDDYRLQIPRLVRHVPGLLILLHKQQNINLPRSEMISFVLSRGCLIGGLREDQVLTGLSL